MLQRSNLAFYSSVILVIICMLGAVLTHAGDLRKNGIQSPFAIEEPVAIIAGTQLFLGVISEADPEFITLDCAEFLSPESWVGQSPVCKNNPTVWQIQRDAITAIQLLSD